MPWGDGVVDVRDMLVLAKYMSPLSVAHWKMDEAEGMLAVDSAGDNEAIVVGGVSWHSGGGKFDGALELNGTDARVIAAKTVNPAKGPFSVFAWVQTVMAGRVIISQQDSSNWLSLTRGKLTTALKSTDGFADAWNKITPEKFCTICQSG